MSDSLAKQSALPAIPGRPKLPPLKIERGQDGRLRTPRVRIHEDDLSRVISPDLHGKDITDLLVAMGSEFIDKTGRYAHACRMYDPATREIVLWIEGGAIINPEVERLKRDSWKEAAIDV